MAENSTDNACNNKYKNLAILDTVLKDDPYAKVPPFFSISSERIENFIKAKRSDFQQLYQNELIQLAKEINPSSENGWYNTLEACVVKVKNLFYNHTPLHQIIFRLISTSSPFPFTPEEEVFLDDTQKNNIFLMVRSSGLEDSKTTANAGLYVSVPYVQPSTQDVQQGVAKVVESYFNPQAIKNNLIAGLDLYNMPLCIPVLVQQLIGEPRGGSLDSTAIPVSGVAFTTQSNLSSEHFKITEINASYGHGEGVVANRVSVDRYYVTEKPLNPNDLTAGITIYPMISYKRQRLIPTNNGLQLLKNPDELINKPCLTTQDIEKLYAVLKKIEASYGQPMDVEFVIQKGTIYIVQARPAMRFEQKPSYIPDTALTETQLNSALQANTLVAGASQVCIISDPEKLLIKDTLDDADADERRTTAQAVFVGAWASSLSHAAVNFIGFGIPCFYVQDINTIKTLAASISAATPLVVDTQRQMIYLWTNNEKAVADAITAGWYEHPIARFLSIVENINSYRIVHDLPVVPQDAALVTIMHNLKNMLGTSNEQNKLFKEAEERITNRIELTKKRFEHKENLCDASCKQSFTAFEHKLVTLLGDFRKALDRNAERLELLFYHKMLEALLYQENDGIAGINRYTYRWFLDDMFVKQSLRGKLNVSDTFAALLEYAKQCSDKALMNKWRECVQSLDDAFKKQRIDQDDIEKLTNLLALLEKVNGLSVWFATVFYQNTKNVPVDSAHIEQILNGLTQDYSESTQEFILFLQSLQDNIATARTLMQQKLETASHFEQFWQELHRILIHPVINEQFIGEFSQASFLSKLLMCNELHKIIDITDESIKLMKSSRTLNFANKRYLFELMLKDFLELCKQWLTGLMPLNAITYHYSWPLSQYLNTVESLFNTIMNKPYTAESEYFQKSTGFSVQAAILGANTAFERHYPDTPEDIFMLIHQNSLVAVAATYKSLFMNTKLSEALYMPDLFRTMFEYIDSDYTISKSLTGIDYDDTKIVLRYNMPLRNHSATFQVLYNAINQEATLQVQYLGEARSRWEQIAFLAATSPELSGLVLDGPIIFDWDGGIATCSWKVDSIETLKTVLAYLNAMNDISFSDIQSVPLKPLNKTNDSLQTVLNKALSLSNKRIKGTLKQSWRSIIQNIRN